MSQINPMDQQPKEEERKKRPILLWIIILLLSILCIFLLMRVENVSKDISAKQAQLDSVKSDKNDLQSDFEAASVKIDQLISENIKLDSSLQRDQQEILDLQKRIKGLLSNKKASSADLSKAKELIATLNTKTSQYEARIAELEKENMILSNKNAVLVKERDSTVTQNIAIKKLASVLHVSNLRMEAIHKTRKGRENTTSKARKADLLRIIFDIDENRVAESGNKSMFLRIVGPNGEVLSNPANGSGNLLTAKGDWVKFSVMREIPIVKSEKATDVAIDWSQDGDYARGTYLIEVYSDGYKIGSGEVRLR